MKAVLNFVANTVTFVVGYVALMTPTYILPYLGSNSVIVNSASAASGQGIYALLLIHVAFLGGLVLLAWARGKLIGKDWLIGLPIAAAMFDLIPGLSLIPLAPTVLHLAAIIVGVKNEAKTLVA